MSPRIDTAEIDQVIRDEWALKRLAQQYAAGADRRDPALFAGVFVEEGVIEGPNGRIEGRARIAEVPAKLTQRYKSTLHTVLNQTVEIEGDSATGETYCLAYHLLYPEEGRHMTRDWAIRYQDRFVRRDGEWKFLSRKLLVDWERLGEVRVLDG